LVIENRDGQPIYRDVMDLVAGGHPLGGFEVEPVNGRATTNTFTALEPGVPQTVSFASIDPAAWDDRSVKVVISLERGSDVWGGRLHLVELPPPRAFSV
jgi:hypothetical protein